MGMGKREEREQDVGGGLPKRMYQEALWKSRVFYIKYFNIYYIFNLQAKVSL